MNKAEEVVRQARLLDIAAKMLLFAASPPCAQIADMLYSLHCTQHFMQTVQRRQKDSAYCENWIDHSVLEGAPNLVLDDGDPILKVVDDGDPILGLKPEDSRIHWAARPLVKPLLLSAEHLYKLSWLSLGCPSDIIELAAVGYEAAYRLQRRVLAREDRAIDARTASRGVILIMDMTKSTPFVFAADDQRMELAERLTRLSAVLFDLGSLIILQDNRSRFWTTEGDKFVAFMPTGCEQKREDPRSRVRYIDFLVSIRERLKSVKAATGIGFKAGAHYGWINEIGGKYQTNEDVIIANRAMEFSKQDDTIIVTGALRQFILEGADRDDGVERRFVAPQVLQEGKPSVWMRPREVRIHLHDLPAGSNVATPQDMQIYELIGRDDVVANNR